MHPQTNGSKKWYANPGQTKILSNQGSDTRKETEIDHVKVEILTRRECTKYLGQMITFQQQETTEIRNRIRAVWATFHKYRQELTSRHHLLKHRLRLFAVVVTPTMCCASGTWTPTKEHERMIQSTQRKILRLVIQTKRRYKKIVQRKDETDEKGGNEDLGSAGDESADGQSSTTQNDQDSDESFENDTDEEIDTIEYIKRSTDEAMEKVENAKIRCWNKTHKRMKWRLALRIATSPNERWLKKAAEWNPQLRSKYRTNRAIGRPRKNGKTTSTNSSNLKKTRQKTSLKEAAKSTKHGSTQQKPAEDGLYTRTNTQ